jgi:hypothetical protein
LDFFRRPKYRRKFFKKNNQKKPVIFENLEQRILLSGNDISGIADNLIQQVNSDDNLQIIELSSLDYSNVNEIITAYDKITSDAAIERTEIVLYQSSLLESGNLSLNSQGLQFNFNPAAGMSQQAIDAFQDAADLLSAFFTDDIIVNIDIDFRSLSSGVLGTSSFTMQLSTYSEIRNALNNDKKSQNDISAVNNLTTDSDIDVYINRTSNNPNGSGSSIPYLDNDADANNTRMRMTTANAKALGLLNAGNTTTNASITFNSNFTWDFNRNDGITAGAYDFVGVALHEICHALGFTSGVDYLDENPGYADNVYAHISPLDLFRYSDNSISAGADIDWTADTRSKFFSVNGGVTSLATFSTGVTFGDGYENSHWKDNMNFGIMDPTGSRGQLMDITYLDLTAMDVIGWDLAQQGISIQQLPYTQDFSAGKPAAAQGWEYYSDSQGQIQVINGKLRLDDSGDDWTYSLNEAILHLDLTGKTNVTLSLDHTSISDENEALPTSFTGHYKGDGIALSVDGINWETITSLTTSFTGRSFSLDSILAQAKTAAGSTEVSDVRIKFQQYDNSYSPYDGREFDNINISVKTSIAQTLPYTQDFSAGKPAAAQGWEYYSDNEGQIQVIDGKLRLDDFGDNWTYSLNEAILHLDLTGKTNVTLTLDHTSISDENEALPTSFTGHYKGDGIALSVDGINWVTITSLTTSFTGQTFALNSIISQAKTMASSTDVSNVCIKFQQYDNSYSPYDGREFDNISVKTSIAQTLPYTQDFSAGKPATAQGWEYYSDSQGQINVVGGKLRLDDSGDDWTYSLNEAILHLDLTGKTNVTLSLDHTSISDENTALPASFSGHYKGDGIALSVDGINWVTVISLTTSFTGQTFALDSIIDQAKTIAGRIDVSDVRIKFQQYDNSYSPYDGREFDNIKVLASISQTLPYTQDFSAGKPATAQGWEYYSDNEGQIQVIDGKLRLDDFGDNWTYSLNEAILHLDLTGKTNVTLKLDHTSISDENKALPSSFTGHYKGDGIALSVDGINWVTVISLTTSFTGQTFALDSIIDQAKTIAGRIDVSDVRIKFQQYDNSFSPYDGREFDNIQVYQA